jgi:hypothetical protein
VTSIRVTVEWLNGEREDGEWDGFEVHQTSVEAYRYADSSMDEKCVWPIWEVRRISIEYTANRQVRLAEAAREVRSAGTRSRGRSA